jgi:hypothetical protein
MTPEEERKLLMQLVSGQISKEQYEAKRYQARMDALRAGLPSNTANEPESQLLEAAKEEEATEPWWKTQGYDSEDEAYKEGAEQPKAGVILYDIEGNEHLVESSIVEELLNLQPPKYFRNKPTKGDYDTQVPSEAGTYEEAVGQTEDNRRGVEAGEAGEAGEESSSTDKSGVGQMYWGRYDSGSWATSTEIGKPAGFTWGWELPEFAGLGQNDFLSDKSLNDLLAQVTGGGEGQAEGGEGQAEGQAEGGEAVTSFTNSQIWEKDGNKYVVWQIPNTLMFMRYAATESELNMLYSGRQRPSVVSPSDDIWTSSVYFGKANELDDKVIKEGESPFLGFVDTFDKATLGRPWLKTDDGMFKLWTEGFVEDREILPEEWANTEWWNNSTKEKREWLVASKGRGISDPNLPADAKTLLEENRFRFRQLLKQSGISNIDAIKDANGTSLSEFFGDQVSFGNFSEALALEQVKALSDRTSGIQVDERITNWLQGKGTVEQTKAGYAAVQEMADRWLGPAYGKLDEETMASYASIYRNAQSEEVGRFEINERLKSARRALFNPEIYDETLTYEDIATPWRNWAFSYLGERMNETSDSFMKILQSNDQNVAQQEATVYGLNTDNETVYDKVTSDLIEAIGADVQRGFST